MVDFVAHKHDVLLATTIIENGLDIPNANDHHNRSGSAASRSSISSAASRAPVDRRACHPLIPPGSAVTGCEEAARRIGSSAISAAGSGSPRADLETRGQQPSRRRAERTHRGVGFDMYMKLLEQTIKELKGEELEDEIRANVNLQVDLRIDETYIPDMNQRLAVYRRMAAVRTSPELDRLMDEVRDRYGPPPESVLNLAEYAAIRLLADRMGLESLDREGQIVQFRLVSGSAAVYPPGQGAG